MLHGEAGVCCTGLLLFVALPINSITYVVFTNVIVRSGNTITNRQTQAVCCEHPSSWFTSDPLYLLQSCTHLCFSVQWRTIRDIVGLVPDSVAANLKTAVLFTSFKTSNIPTASLFHKLSHFCVISWMIGVTLSVKSCRQQRDVLKDVLKMLIFELQRCHEASFHYLQEPPELCIAVKVVYSRHSFTHHLQVCFLVTFMRKIRRKL